MCSVFLEDPPWLRNARPRSIDTIGFGLLVLWISSLQIVLDKGQTEDWFSSRLIVTLSTISAMTFVVFLIWELRTEHPIVNLRVFLDRNLTIGAVLLFIVGAVLYGTTSVLPLFMQNLLGWTATTAGFVMSPRGVGAIADSIVAARVLASKRIDGRMWICVAVFCSHGPCVRAWWDQQPNRYSPSDHSNRSERLCDHDDLRAHDHLFDGDRSEAIHR